MGIRNWLMTLLLVAVVANIGIIFSMMIFEAQECRLFTEEYGWDFAGSNIDGCKLLFAQGYLSVSSFDNSAFPMILIPPIGIGIVLAALAYRGKAIVLIGFPYYFGVLTMLAFFVLIGGVLGVFGFMTDGYYLDTRCPVNSEEIGADCSFILKNYNLGILQHSFYLGFSASATIALIIILKIIREGIDTMEFYKNRNKE